MVTAKTYRNIEINLTNLLLARYMVYKWLPPFNEMYIALRQQNTKIGSKE